MNEKQQQALKHLLSFSHSGISDGERKELENLLVRTVALEVTRRDTWYAHYEVPAHMNDFDATQYIDAISPDEVFDEMCHKRSLETVTTLEVIRDTDDSSGEATPCSDG